MEQIKNDTKDISPLFWLDYESNRDYRCLRNECIKNVLTSENIDTNLLNTKIELANFCDILILLLKNVEKVYNGDFSSYLDILNVMCIYSSLIRELNKFERSSLAPYLKNTSINILEEFIDIFNNFEDVLDEIDEISSQVGNISNEVNKSINKTKELYLRVSLNI